MQIPLSIVMNLSAGQHAVGYKIEVELIVQSLKQAGFNVQLFRSEKKGDLTQCIQQALARHLQKHTSDNIDTHHQGIIVAAGGDGTINAVAQQLLNTGIELGILPLGTFNYVARALNIPIHLPQAVENLIKGRGQSIHVGCVNKHIYLNNASIGIYPVIIEKRELYNRRFGRFPLVAYLSGLTVLFQPQKYYKLKIKIDDEKMPLDTPMIFFGNNQLQLKDFKLHLAECAQQGKLAGVALAKVSQWQLLQLIIKLFRGQFEQAQDVHAFCAESVEISCQKRKMKVALDGEIVKLRTPLHFQVLHDAIKVRVPDVTASV